MIGFIADREKQFGGDEVAVARMAVEGFAEDALGFAGSVLVGCVKEGDAVVESGMNAADGLFAADATGDGEPGAKAQFRDFKWATAQTPKLHCLPS